MIGFQNDWIPKWLDSKMISWSKRNYFTLYLLDIFISYAHDIQFPDLPIQCELWDLSIEHVFQLNHLEAKKLQLHTEADQLPILRVEIWIISSKPEEKWQKCWLLLSSCSPSISSLYTFCQYYRYTMLQKLSKCEVKAWLCWNLIILLSFRFYVKSNFGEFKMWKCHFWHY